MWAVCSRRARALAAFVAITGNNWQLNGTGGAVINNGEIVAGAGGAILAAVRVENHGKITAQGGDVSLGAGSAFTVDFAGSMVGFEVKKAADGASVVHDGVIESQGGVVSLSAQEAQAVRTNVVSVGGVVKATRIERRGGVVYLSGGDEGVAEVSGDVQASEQIQTTGEDVVVKEGAVLTAPDILVGGDFQGRGNVPTAQRTLVEAGALLDAGAEGRVIVWSDETTWFNGNINVPGGFAEVSGKRNLAAVNLPGIHVGASGTLLLDPLNISIVETSTTLLPAAALGGTTLAVASINSFTGNLALAGSNTITVNVPIDKMGAGGDLSLISGTIIILANIDNGTGNVTLTGSEEGVRVEADITTTGNIILTGVASSTQPAIRFENGARVLRGGNITLNGSAGVLTSTTEPARNGGSVTLNASGLLRLTDNIDTGTNNLTLTGATIQIARAAGMPADTRILLSGQNITLTSASGIEIGRINRGGVFLMNNSAASFIVTADGALTIAADIMAADGTRSGGDIALTSRSTTTPIAFTGARTITGRDITLSGNVTSNANLTLTATGILTFIGDSIATGTGNLSLTSGTIQIGRAVSTPVDTRIVLRGQDVTLTAADGILLGRFTGREIFRSNSDVANLTVRADGTLTIAADITAADGIRSGGDIALTGGSIAFGAAARTITGRAITLTGEAAGTADLTLTASGTLTLNNDIDIGTNALTLTSGAGAIVGAGRPRLTASTVRLAQDAAFPATRSFRLSAGSLEFTTEAAQDVHDWMILENIDLTVTSSNRVRVAAIIGAGGVAGRNLGTGALSLTSTGGAVRILAGISTTGSITLIGVTGGINFNSGAGAKTFSGAAITLSGDVRSDRDLAITASGTLTLNNDIDIGTNALTLTSGVGAIVATGRPRLTAGMVSLAQVDAFPVTRTLRVIPGSSLAITTEAAQDVHDWMIRENIDLTVTSSNRVRVAGAIGDGLGGRDLGTGALSLTSTGGAVRILANISTTGGLTLSGVTGGINLNGGAAKTLAGAIITLTGDARGNRDLTITASGVLTINNNINIGTSALTLTGASFTFGSSVDLTAGDHIFDPIRPCDGSTTPTCTDTTP